MLLRSHRGVRRLRADEFCQGPMVTALAEDELLVTAELPMLREGVRTGLEEFSRRKGDFAIAMALVAYRLRHGVMVEPRLAIGGAESRPRRVPQAEDALRGRAPGADAFADAGEAAAAVIEPMEDVHNTTAYRRRLVRTLLQRAEGAQ